jgi:hypothetical protein
MSLRNWRLRRIVGLSFLWVLLLVAASVARVCQVFREVRNANPAGDWYVAVHFPGIGLLLLGPPLAVTAVWWWLRRSRPAS